MSKKHNFHCQACGQECTIYKKGKGHRVLVCPQHGVIATNPIALPKVLQKAYNVAKTLPFGNTIGAGLEEFGIIGKESSAKAERTDPHSHSRLTPFEKALLLERLESH